MAKKLTIHELLNNRSVKNPSFLSGTSTGACESSEFDCKDAGCTNPGNEKCRGTCIPKHWVNDGDEECADGSDEGVIGIKILVL